MFDDPKATMAVPTMVRLLALYCSKLELLEQSSNWIRPEELENRIEEALSNPVELYENVSKEAYTTKTV